MKTIESAKCGICNNPNHNTETCNSTKKKVWRLTPCNICNGKGHTPKDCPVEKIAEEVVLMGLSGLEVLSKGGKDSSR